MIIYKISNTFNKKVYIGQTVTSLKIRWTQHKSDALCNKKATPLYKAIKKYGIENFIIEEIDGANSLSELNYKEWLLIHKHDSMWPNGYNMKEGGSSGAVHKISRSNKTVIDINTKKTWTSAKECAKEIGIDVRILRTKLSGRNINNTSLRYLKTKDICKKPKKRFKKERKHLKIDSQEYKNKMSVISKKIASQRFSKKFNVYKILENNKIELVGSWYLKRECAKDLNIHESGISAALLKRVKINKGYIFKYEESDGK